MGIGGAEAFHGQWLDLQPHIDKAGFDMSQFPESTVDLYNAGGEGQLGIPYAVYPSVFFYKADMFKEAGLAEPPHEWNSEYTMPDGSKRPWDYDTVREIAKILTVDENGADATEAGFDPEKIVQWGFEPQRDDLRQTGAYFGAGSFMAADGKTVEIPAPWAAAWKHFYDGIWTDHFSMTGPIFETTDINPAGYPFCAGKVAMSTNYLWSTYCVSDAGDDWNMAATPSYQGQTTAAFNADTWRIMKSSKNPDQAFEVLLYLLSNEDLLALYGGMPAVESKQDAFLTAQFADYTQGIDTKVAKDGVAFADVPELRIVHAGVQPVARLAEQVRDQVADDARTRPERRDRGDARRDAGRLGRGRQLIHGQPQRRATATQPRFSGLGWRRARWGYAFIAPWLIGFLAFTAIPMIATLVFSFTNINLAQAEPLSSSA